MATLITQEAALSFLGVGVPQHPVLGNMMADGREYLQGAWWLSTLPGIALMAVVLGSTSWATACAAPSTPSCAASRG